MPYKPFGVMVDKGWVFVRGGRPVIYQPACEFALLHDDQKFRHKTYDPTTSNEDFTWEREWRIRTDELSLDPDTTTVVVPNRAWVRKVLQTHEAMLQRRAPLTRGMFGAPMPTSEIKSPWHFIALEDLGVPIPADEQLEQPGDLIG